MSTLITVTQFFLSLSILVILHEFGHYWAARAFGTRVEKFYLFWNPWFSLFKKKIGETEWGIGWLPLGGYVKISGMIDESFDREQMAEPVKPWEFRSKPAWQRLIIMIGGVVVNFILGVLIFAMIAYKWGDVTLPIKNAKYGVAVYELGEQLGLENGDKILSVGDKEIVNLIPTEISKEIVINGARTINVDRGGQIITLSFADSIAAGLSSYDNRNVRIIAPRMPVTIAQVAPESPAASAGLRQDDQLLKINDQDAFFYDQFTRISADHSGETIHIAYLRGGDTLSTDITLTDEGKLGFFAYDWRRYLETERSTYGLVSSLGRGWNRSFEFLRDQIKAFGQMFRGKLNVQDSLGGPVAIATMFGPVWDWYQFWNLTASLSLILGFMNLLPIPGLDGGHVMFLLWEVITGRKPSDQVVEYATMVGFFFLMALMVLIFWVDISRLF